MMQSTKDLILSVFRSYKKEYPLTTHTLLNIETVERALKVELNETVEDKILEHIGDRLFELNKPSKSKLQEEKQVSAINELKMILEIIQNK